MTSKWRRIDVVLTSTSFQMTSYCIPNDVQRVHFIPNDVERVEYFTSEQHAIKITKMRWFAINYRILSQIIAIYRKKIIGYTYPIANYRK